MASWFLFQLSFFNLVFPGTKTILRWVVAHILEVTLVEVVTLLGQEEVDQIIVTFEVLCANQKKPLGLLTLLIEHGVHGILIETIDQFDEVVLQ